MGFFVNIIQGNVFHFSLKTNDKSGSYANIRGYLNGHRKRWSQGKEGRVIPQHLKHFIFIQIFLANGDIFLYVTWCVMSVLEAASVEVCPREKIPIDIEYIPGTPG